MKKPLLMVMLALLSIAGATYTARAQLINVSIAGRNLGEITKKEISVDSMLSVREPGVEVISFQMNHFGPFLDSKEYQSNNNKLTPQMRKEFKYLRNGDLLFFIHIKAKNANGDTLWADPLKFKIK